MWFFILQMKQMSKPETKKMVARKKDCNFKSKAQKVRIWCIPLISRCSLCLIFVGPVPVCFSRTSCIKSLIFVSTTEYSTTLCSFFWNERSTSLIKKTVPVKIGTNTAGTFLPLKVHFEKEQEALAKLWASLLEELYTNKNEISLIHLSIFDTHHPLNQKERT